MRCDRCSTSSRMDSFTDGFPFHLLGVTASSPTPVWDATVMVVSSLSVVVVVMMLLGWCFLCSAITDSISPMRWVELAT